MKDYIVIARLITGETVIGKLDGEYLRNVISIMMMPSGNGQMGITLVPYMMPFSDEEVDLDVKYIVYSSTANSDMEASYIKATTGLIIPKIQI